MSGAFEVSPDDPAGLAEAIRRAAAGETVHVVRAGAPLADIVPPCRTSRQRSADPDDAAGEVMAGPASAVIVGPAGEVPATAPRGIDECELDDDAMAALEARMASRPAADLTANQVHAARFGAPTLAHYRAVYAQARAPWPGEAFVRRHHPVADPT